MLAEQIVLYESGVVPLPEGYGFEEVATLPCAAVTAWNVLMVAGRAVRAGDTVLVLGTGGVAVFALLFARCRRPCHRNLLERCEARAARCPGATRR
jgi:NADPH:quinone reductase-like Zn-dependent oxidoreductase